MILNKIVSTFFTTIIISMGMGSYVYYKVTENKMSELYNEVQTQRENIIACESGQREQVRTIDALEKNLQKTTENLNIINNRNSEISREIERYLKIFSRHDLSKLASAKPELIQTMINRGTKDVFDSIEDDSVIINSNN